MAEHLQRVAQVGVQQTSAASPPMRSAASPPEPADERGRVAAAPLPREALERRAHVRRYPALAALQA